MIMCNPDTHTGQCHDLIMSLERITGSVVSLLSLGIVKLIPLGKHHDMRVTNAAGRNMLWSEDCVLSQEFMSSLYS